MPIYEFECHACGEHFDQLVLPWIAETVSATPECPSCHTTDVGRVLSVCAVSSAETRQASLQKARKANRKIQREKEDAEFKQMIQHANEHH
jgi:putative FmdB family regulatory protein